jgi:hypothetical protein
MAEQNLAASSTSHSASGGTNHSTRNVARTDDRPRFTKSGLIRVRVAEEQREKDVHASLTAPSVDRFGNGRAIAGEREDGLPAGRPERGPSLRVGSAVRVDADELERWLVEQRSTMGSDSLEARSGSSLGRGSLVDAPAERVTGPLESARQSSPDAARGEER